MSHIPKALEAQLAAAFENVMHPEIRAQLAAEGRDLYQTAWNRYFRHRTHADNRLEHELVVLKHFFQIAGDPSTEEPIPAPPLSLSELRVGLATCILHDTCFIPRITEAHIADARSEAEAEELRKRKASQRRDHMRGSARNAKRILAELAASGHGWLNHAETLRCVGLIALHDIWKLGFPWPPAHDRLAVCFVEADALWPVSHPTGPLADLQRDNGEAYQPSPQQLSAQALVNLNTQLRAYRPNFEATAEAFQDSQTIIRTKGGARILAVHLAAWGLGS